MRRNPTSSATTSYDGSQLLKNPLHNQSYVSLLSIFVYFCRLSLLHMNMSLFA